MNTTNTHFKKKINISNISKKTAPVFSIFGTHQTKQDINTFNKTGEVHARPSVAPPPYLIMGNLPVFKPFFPNFMNYFAMSSGIYEGIPLLPTFYSNARNQ